MHEDGIGMARTFEAEFNGRREEATRVRAGFFAWVDGAPAAGYRSSRTGSPEAVAVTLRPRPSAPVGVLTGTYGALVIAPLVASTGRPDVRVIPVENRFFGGNIGVSGLLVGDDIARVLAAEPAGHRYLLPDVCLSNGRFLDGSAPSEMPRPVEVVATDGLALRRALSVGVEPPEAHNHPVGAVPGAGAR